MLCSFFFHQKIIKNRQALHEIIRASPLSISFVKFSFKTVYLTTVVKIFKFITIISFGSNCVALSLQSQSDTKVILNKRAKLMTGGFL